MLDDRSLWGVWKTLHFTAEAALFACGFGAKGLR
jgi:hypothetical protein